MRGLGNNAGAGPGKETNGRCLALSMGDGEFASPVNDGDVPHVAKLSANCHERTD